MKIILSALAFVWAAGALAEPTIPAQAVYPGCEQPPTLANAYWYFDPVNGDDLKGDGSTAKPWMHISALFTAVRGNPNTPLLSTISANRAGTPPVDPGDALVLKSGNYGDVTFGSGMSPHVDVPQWISVLPDTGAKPVFHSLYIGNTERWAFSGFEVQSGKVATWTAMIEIAGNNNNGGITHDLAFTNIKIDSADESVWRTWTTPDPWDDNTRIGFASRSGSGTYCVSLTASHLQAVSIAVAITSPSALVQGIEIDHFIGDGIDIAASNITLVNNKIHDIISPKNGLHTDGIQGQFGRAPPGLPYDTYDNVLIDGNWVQAIADSWIKANPSLVNYLQGIVGFDGDWAHLKITNNVVITHGCWGIWFGSTHDSLMANNTVIWDGLPSANCKPVVTLGGRTHQGPVSTNGTVVNNMGPSMGFRADPGFVWDKNVCVSAPGEGCLFAYLDPTGKAFFYGKPGTYPGNTMIDDATKPGGSFNQYVLVNNPALSYDLRLAPEAQARLWGTMTQAPIASFGGGKRAINPGAY